jgi:aerobic-type carbon monoxide dehydrogenase small subunit (CoxS/CutS family)
MRDARRYRLMADDTRSMVAFVVNGEPHHAAAGDSVVAALLNAGIWHVRHAVDGVPRAPLCGMGICYECRVTIDGVAHRRACLIPVAEGMNVRTTTGSGE